MAGRKRENRRKRILSLALALCLLFSLAPGAAYADEAEPSHDHDHDHGEVALLLDETPETEETKQDTQEDTPVPGGEDEPSTSGDEDLTGGDEPVAEDPGQEDPVPSNGTEDPALPADGTESEPETEPEKIGGNESGDEPGEGTADQSGQEPRETVGQEDGEDTLPENELLTEEPADEASEDEEPEEDDKDKEDEEEPAEDEEKQPVTVIFQLAPAEAELMVYRNGTEGTILLYDLEADGSYRLLPGDYFYSAFAEGYTPVQEQAFTVAVSQDPLVIPVKMEELPEAEIEEFDSLTAYIDATGALGREYGLSDAAIPAEQYAGDTGDPYLTRRLLVITGGELKSSRPAVRVLHYGDEYVLQYKTEEETARAFEEMQALGRYDFVTPDALVAQEPDMPTEPVMFANSYGESAKKPHYSWGVTVMGLDKMEEAVVANCSPLPTVIVAVADSGVEINNQYLAGRLLPGYNTAEGGSDITDAKGHGTCVAGVVVDGTPSNVMVLPIKVLNSEGTGPLLAVKNAILYAIEQHADVINLSLSGIDADRTTRYLESTFEQARNAGMVIVVSAGNDSADVMDYYPSRSPQVITVAALTTGMTKASYSNYGEAIDFALPGSTIATTYKMGLSYKSGTSFAAPHAAAAAALLKCVNKAMGHDQIQSILTQYSVDLGDPGWDPLYGNGYIDLSNYQFPSTEHTHSYTAAVTKEATCTENGQKTYTCACGDSYEETVPALGHAYTQTEVAPTCTEDGYTEYTCSRCGDRYTKDARSATGHNYQLTAQTQPSCTVKGTKTYTCQACGDSYQEDVAATGHNYDTTEVAATCTEAGYIKHVCQYCGDTIQTNYPALDHAYTQTVVAPTCTEAGYTEHVCSRCGDSYTDTETPALGHQYAVTEQTAEGYRVLTCSVCGDSYRETLAALTHVHSYTQEMIAPTCTTKGYTKYTCATCGDSYNDSFVDKLGHDYHLTNETAATCTSEGIKHYTCSRCDDFYEITSPKVAHQYVETVSQPSCDEWGEIKRVCSVCRDQVIERIPPTGHNYTERVIAATCLSEGFTMHVCSVCSDSYKDNYTEKLAHQWEETVIQEETCDNDGKMVRRYCPLCGTNETVTTRTRPQGHEYVPTVLEPTCTSPGETEYKCVYCGNHYTVDVVPALGHDYRDTSVTPPTCTEMGFTLRTCARCGDTMTEGFAELDHDYTITTVEPTCTEDGYLAYECNLCGDSFTYPDPELKALGHTTELRNAREATCAAAGYTGDQVCTRCEQVIQKGSTIARKAHTPGAARRENEVPVKNGKNGSYDEVVYCTVCNQQVSRKSYTIYATYTIRYDANGGTGAPGAQTKTNSTALTLSSTRPSRSGYSFQGWAASKNAATAQYQPGGRFTTEADTTLYAVWTKNAPADPVVSFVERCYNLILNRSSDPHGLADWTSQLRNHTAAGADIVNGFVNSPEFLSRGLSNAQVVEIMYRTMLDREADAGGKADWVSRLDSGVSYSYIVNGFSGSMEFNGICNSYGINAGSVTLTESRDQNVNVTAFVNRCYNLILNRQGEPGGLNNWTALLLSGQRSGAQIVDEFTRSQEYINRHLSSADSVEILYKTMLGRPSDPNGKADWMDQLSRGATLRHVVDGFAGSVEFGGICANYGIQAGRLTDLQPWKK